MIGAVWKLITFTSMVNRIINTSSNERIILQFCDTCLQMFDVRTLGHTAHIETVVQFLPHSEQHVRCDGLHSRGNSILQIRYARGRGVGLRMRTKRTPALSFHVGNLLLRAFSKP
jgi:hypothetical protein